MAGCLRESCFARAARATSRRTGGSHDERLWRTPWRAAPPLQSVRLPTRNRSPAYLFVPSPPNVISLSCAARARVATAARHAGCRRLTNEPICSRRDAAPVLFGPGGSAAGPKPGRDSCCELLGGHTQNFARLGAARAPNGEGRGTRARPTGRRGFWLLRRLWPAADENHVSRAALATSRRPGGYHDERLWRTPWRAALPLQSVRLPARKWKSGLRLRAGSAQRLSPKLQRGPTCVRRCGTPRAADCRLTRMHAA